MESTRRRRSGRLGRLITAVFALAFVASIISTIAALAAANLFRIENAELSELSTTAEGSISSFDETNIVSNVTFHKLGDFAKYTITLKNTDSNDHVIESITDDNESPYINYVYDSHAGEQINAGENLIFVVTAKYFTSITDVNQRAQANNVKFFIHFTDLEEEIPVVPNTGTNSNTGDHIHSSVLSLVISAAGLIIIGIIALKKHKKASKFIAAGIVAVAAIATTATVKAATVEINSFTINTSYALMDKLVVTYTDKDGNDQELIVGYGEPANIPDQSKDGYTLTGWEDENGSPVDLSQPVTEDIKIHPVYRAHTYTVKFNGNGATSGEMADLAMTYDETKTLPANAFDFPGRTYAGWDTEANGSGIHYDDVAEVKNLTIEDNGIVTLYAQWSINPFHIDYDGNGATSGNMATTNCEYDQACQLRENAFEKTGYHFIGWKYNNNDYADKADVRNIIESGTITMVAQWEVNHYTIVFDINTDDSNASGDMADMANLEYDHDYTLTANAYTRTGYNFGGWNTEIDGRNFGLTDEQEFHNLTTTDNAVITLYAQWDPTRYTIIFHANNENVENPDAMAAQVVTYDVETTLSPIAYTWWQHKLVEWTTNANGTGTKYADKATIKNLNANGGEVHLYAKWREIDAALDGRGNMTNKGINTKLKAITTANPDAKNFLHYPNGEPSDEIKASATDLSGTIDPIYAWVDGENIYWWSEDVKPRISTNNSIEYHYYGVGKSTAEGNVNNLEYMDLTGFDTTGIVGSRSPFEYTNIRKVDISDWDLSNATDMSYFAYASKLEDIIFPEHFDIQKVTSLNMAFSGAKLKKLDFRGWKTRDLQFLTNFIQSMPTITEVTFGGDFNTDNVTSMYNMINANANLATINNIDTLNTAKVTTMRSMFDSDAAITSLDLSTFDTTALTDMTSMFKNMSGLTSLTLKGSFTAANVTNMEGTFYGVKNINTFDLSNLVSKPTNLKQTFAFTGGGAIETIDISNMDLSDVTTVEWTFFNANSGLKTIYTSSSVNPEVVTNNTATFQYDTGLVGGANTHTYDVGGISSGAGSRIDDPDNGKPGYFTYKNARYIRYHDNDGNDTNDEVNYALMKSHYVTTDSENPYTLATKLAENSFERSGFKFMGWAKTADGEVVYADGATISEEASKTPLELYAVWVETTSTLQTGGSVNTILKSINADATVFAHYAAGTPDFDAITDEQIISTDDSVVPTYAWNDNGTIYWWSETDKVYINESGDEMFRDLSSIESIDLEGLNFSNNVTLNRMFAFDSSLKEIKNINALNTPNVTSISHMFYDCSSLESLNLSGWDTSNIEKVEHVFTGTTNLSTLYLDEWNLTNFDSNIVLPTSLTTISMKNAVAAEDMTRFFASQANLTSIDLTNFNTSNTKTMAGMFTGCTSLESLNVSSFDTSNVENMSGMFGYLSSLQTLDVSNFNTSNVKNMYGMFAHMDSLQSLNIAGFNTEKVENMNRMFSFSYALNELDISSFDTSSVSDMESMFHYSNVKQIYASEDFDTTNTTSYAHIFQGMTTGLKGGQGTQWNASIEGNKNYATIDDPDNDKPGLFSLKGARYIRYHDNDGDDTNNEANYALMTSHYLTNTGSLKANAFTNGSKTFIGWTTAADGAGDSYTDGQAMTELTESKTPLELYAQWEQQAVQLVTFDDAYSAAGKTKVNNYYTMQDMDSSICNVVTTPVNTDNSDAMTTQLLDARDNKVYRAGKLADGRCWLLDNLSLDLTDADVQDNLTEDTTNASNTTLSYLKNGGGGGEDQYAMSGATIWTTNYNYSIPYIITAYSDTTGSGGYEAGKYGVYYTYCAATAGSYCYGGSPNYYNYGNASGDATEDICPKGWRLPTSGNSGETNTVSLAYNSDRISVINALHTPFSGDAVYGYDASSGQRKLNLYQGTAAHFWTSTFGDSTFMRSFAISETELIPSSSHYRTNATSVRCIAK